jgi:regulator of protease activity HflC (stomatin/prohibitin superfamily)
MDILQLVDRLEELFNESRPIWLTHSVIVNEDKFLDIIDQMRISIPEEVKKAQQLYAQKDRILAQAQEEANRTIELARQKAAELVEKDILVIEAQRRAAEILEQANREAEEIRNGADQYSHDVLAGLVEEMERLLNQARNGMMLLEQKSKIK